MYAKDHDLILTWDVASSFDMFPYYDLILNITTIEGTKRPEHK